MNKLNSIQKDRIKNILKNARIMNDEDLEALRCNISSSDGNMQVKEVYIRGYRIYNE